MKMLFFSSDNSEVEQAGREFNEAGIACEVRKNPALEREVNSQAELWVLDDRDCHRALMLCVHRNIGFAKRSRSLPSLDIDYVLEEN